jgi:hypothetical protein
MGFIQRSSMHGCQTYHGFIMVIKLLEQVKWWFNYALLRAIGTHPEKK